MHGTALDHASAGDGFSAPGQDPRQWVSYGTVAQDSEGQRSVEFTAEYGPLVDVILHPSNVPCRCRVAMSMAGAGEGEWHPFMPGDEVIVVVPEGDERAGCVIVGRLSNEIDSWPERVAGADATKNNVSFQRLRAPRIIETATSFLVRHATTGAFFGIDQQGAVTIGNADSAFLAVKADFLGLQNGDGDVLIQIDTSNKEVVLEAAGTKMILGADASTFASSGTLALAAGGQLATGHAVTFEQVVLLLANYTVWLGTVGAAGAPPPVGLGWATTFLLTPASFAAAFAGFISGAAAGTVPLTNVSPGGNLVAMAPLVAGIKGALQSGADPASALDVTGQFPGMGRPSIQL